MTNFTSEKLSIAVLGSVNLDFIIKTEKLPVAGETIMNGDFKTLPGGKGANVAMVAQRLGANVALWACVGDDVYADIALSSLRAEGVDLSHVKRLRDEATGVAFINVSNDGENQIAVASGANVAFKAGDLSELKANAIISQFEIPSEVILKAIEGRDAFVCVNASPVGPDLSPLLPYIDLLIVNEGEYVAYKERLCGFEGVLAVTLGGEGAEMLQGGQVIAKCYPPKVEVVDTTGAGDSFAAALTVALLEGADVANALKFACTVGALTTTKIGTQTAAPHRNDVDALLR